MYLNCHTWFSFKYGTLSVERLFAEAKRCSVHKLVLTEINNTASYIEMLRLCAEHAPCQNRQNKFGGDAYPLEIAVGIEFRRDNELLYVAVAKNNTGFGEINRFLSHYNLTGKPLQDRAPVFDHAVVIYPFKKEAPHN